ncbi:MAG: hypothetical protein MK179_00245 [Pirellulaceae bacterium]|nr:hypothetical protein [Pirellulaceae bacterium]
MSPESEPETGLREVIMPDEQHTIARHSVFGVECKRPSNYSLHAIMLRNKVTAQPYFHH